MNKRNIPEFFKIQNQRMLESGICSIVCNECRMVSVSYQVDFFIKQ